MVSSSAIRSLIDAGQMAEAVELLGHPYRLRGEVTNGAGAGGRSVFPRPICARIETLIPGDGVYAGIARIDAVPLPPRSTSVPIRHFAKISRKVEVHLIDFSGDLYGQNLDVDFLQRLRRHASVSIAGRADPAACADVAAAGPVAQILNEATLERTGRFWPKLNGIGRDTGCTVTGHWPFKPSLRACPMPD